MLRRRGKARSSQLDEDEAPQVAGEKERAREAPRPGAESGSAPRGKEGCGAEEGAEGNRTLRRSGVRARPARGAGWLRTDGLVPRPTQPFHPTHCVGELGRVRKLGRELFHQARDGLEAGRWLDGTS